MIGTARIKRIKLPVWSRLSLAWGATGLIVAGMLVTIFATPKNTDDDKLRLALGNIETLVQPPVANSSSDTHAEEDNTQIALRSVMPLRQAAYVPVVDEDELSATNVDTLFENAPPVEGHIIRLSDISEDAALGFEDDIDDDKVVIRLPGTETARQDTNRAARNRAVTPILPIAAPDTDLLKPSPHGLLPRIAKDGRRPVSHYAKDPVITNRAKLAIIVGGLGLNDAVTTQAIKDLPPEIGLAFVPYAKNLDKWTSLAREYGHEILIELPMEDHQTPSKALGEAALLTSRDDADNLQRLDWVLARTAGYFAVTSYRGSKMSANAARMAPVLKRLHQLGLGYVDTTGKLPERLTRSTLPMQSVSTNIANKDDRGAGVRRALKRFEAGAARNPTSLAKAYASADTIAEIALWAQTLDNSVDDDRPLLVPASTLMLAQR